MSKKRLEKYLAENIPMIAETRYTTPIMSVPSLGDKLPSSPDEKIVFELSIIALIPVNSWIIMTIIATQDPLQYFVAV